ncbi:YaaC family protein [Streptomyces hokutonensis]|uniref:YaaC family protein n=1 Tax=Streptomyces hokutonensis TaxID=1306990 RepID=UPI0037F89F3F
MHSDLDADEAWERLRASRSDPPARADTGSRRKTYSAALEQAQQLFHAASVVGPATSPVLAFYGLSQAGRAITAAAWSLKGEDWRLDTHGIKTTGFHLPFPDIEIRTDPSGTQGSFVKVSEVLDSPVWEMDPLRLEDVWDLLPPNLRYPLTARDRFTPLYTVGDDIGVGTHEHSLLSVPVCDLPDRVIDVGTREALADFLASYPAVAQHESYVTTRALSLGPEAPPEYTRYNHGGGELRMNWLMPEGVGTGFDGTATGAERLAHLRTLTRGYAGSRYFLPVLGSMKRELHPLMAWWAVLYALSMLSRYQPAVWGALISVDTSKHAVPIERLLERAIIHLPVLIADTITEVST